MKTQKKSLGFKRLKSNEPNLVGSVQGESSLFYSKFKQSHSFMFHGTLYSLCFLAHDVSKNNVERGKTFKTSLLVLKNDLQGHLIKLTKIARITLV